MKKKNFLTARREVQTRQSKTSWAYVIASMSFSENTKDTIHACHNHILRCLLEAVRGYVLSLIFFNFSPHISHTQRLLSLCGLWLSHSSLRHIWMWFITIKKATFYSVNAFFFKCICHISFCSHISRPFFSSSNLFILFLLIYVTVSRHVSNLFINS